MSLSWHYGKELIYLRLYSIEANKSSPSLNFIRLLRVVITPSVTQLLRGENDSKQSDEFQAKVALWPSSGPELH